MRIKSDTTILEKILGANYVEYQIFLAEQIIENYIGGVPKEWDEALSIATATLYERLELDSGVKSESTDGHSISYQDMKKVEDLLGARLVALLERYRTLLDPSTTSTVGNFFNLL